MKKNILALCTVLVAGALVFAVASSVSTKSNPKAAARKEKREARQQQAIDIMKAALATQTFTFYPSSYTLPYQNTVEVYDRSDLYLSFYPENLDISLPFELQNDKEFLFDASLVNYSDYSVKATKHPNNMIITAQLNNVSNTGFDSNFDNQNMNLGIHMSLNLATGSSFLTITPDFSAAVTYIGRVIAN